MIDTLRKQRATWAEKDGAAADGDRVNIDYEGFKDGEAFAGGSAKGQNLVLGSGSMIPGFEDGLKGKKAGEQTTLELTFPEDYHAEDLKGAAVEFKVTVNKVEAQQLPEIDAGFMEAFGVKDGDADKFRAEVRKNMERELKNAVTAKVKEQVMDGLVSAHDFEVPQALVQGEILRMRQQMMQQFGGGQQFDPSMLPEELFKDQAERSVRLGLVVREILEKNELKADADKVRARIEEIAEQYEEPQEVINYFYGNPQQLQQVEGAVLEEQVVELVLAGAKVAEKAVSYEEATRRQQG
jgi:trigger factor